MSKKAVSPEQLEELRNLAALPEDQIDASDTPEMAPENLLLARRGIHFRAIKQPVTIRRDADVVQWFKDHASDGKYQSDINRVLRRHVAEAERRRA